MDRTSGFPPGLQLHLTTTNNGKQYKNMKHGTNHTPTNNNTRDNVETRPYAPVEAPHILDHNTMAVVHHLPPMRTGIVLGAVGVGINTGMILPGKAY